MVCESSPKVYVMSAPVVKSYVPQAIKGVKAGTEKAMLETAIRVTAQAKTLAPVDKGQLRGSIMWKAGSGQTGGKTQGPTIQERPPIFGVLVGTAVEHGVYQEYGTRILAAQPFLRPAVFIVTEGAGYKAAVKKAMADTVREKLRTAQ